MVFIANELLSRIYGSDAGIARSRVKSPLLIHGIPWLGTPEAGYGDANGLLHCNHGGD